MPWWGAYQMNEFSYRKMQKSNVLDIIFQRQEIMQTKVYKVSDNFKILWPPLELQCNSDISNDDNLLTYDDNEISSNDILLYLLHILRKWYLLKEIKQPIRYRECAINFFLSRNTLLVTRPMLLSYLMHMCVQVVIKM